METKESARCSVCGQFKPAWQFPKIEQSTQSLQKLKTCLSCCKLFDSTHPEEESDDSSGGLQLKKDVKQLQYAINLAITARNKLEACNEIIHNKDLLDRPHQSFEKEKNKKILQRELSKQEEKNRYNNEKDDQPNPDLSQDSKLKREKITRVFSITRLLAQNHAFTHNAKTVKQKKFSIFSNIQKKQATHQTKEKVKPQEKSATETAALFSQRTPTTDGDEEQRLATAIREAQNIFKQ